MVEVDLAQGLPDVQLVGLPDKAIQESRERVRSALGNSGFRGSLMRVVINLAAADRSHRGCGTRALGKADQPAWAEHAQRPSTVARGAHHCRSQRPGQRHRNAVAEASCFRCTDLLKQPGAQ